MTTLDIEAKKLAIAKNLPLNAAALANLKRDILSSGSVELSEFSINKEIEIKVYGEKYKIGNEKAYIKALGENYGK